MIEILSLIENETSSNDYVCEHGLSLLIKVDDKKYLLDTGASSSFIDNAIKMNVDFTDLDGVILSHNHLDHVSGLSHLLELNNNIKVYVSSEFKQDLFFKKIIMKNINMPNDIYHKYEDRFIFINNKTEIANNLFVLPVSHREKEFICQDKTLYMKNDNKIVKDDYAHEIFVVLKHDNKCIIVSSCSHNGIVNIVRTTQEQFTEPITSIVAGFHMMGFVFKKINCSDEYLNKVAIILDENCEKDIYTFHCTGLPAFNKLKLQLNDKLKYLKTGEKIIYK